MIRLAAVLTAVLALAACGRSVPDKAATGSSPSLTHLRAAADLDACPADDSGNPPSRSALPKQILPCLGDGPQVSLAGLVGRPAVLNLWASWCFPCRKEVPAFQRLYAEAGDRVRVLGVLSSDPSHASALDFARAVGMRYPSVVDDEATLRVALGRAGLPHTVFVRADGSVAKTHTGPLTEAQLRAGVRDVLKVRL